LVYLLTYVVTLTALSILRLYIFRPSVLLAFSDTDITGSEGAWLVRCALLYI
jgi:hypothetical protein